MKDTKIVSIFKKAGAIVTDDHLVGTSGRHMSAYLNKDALTPHTKLASLVGKMFAEKFKNKNIEAVVAPAAGGIAFSQWTAYHLSKLTKRDVLGLFTEKSAEGDQIFKRGYDQMVKGRRVLVIEDLTTTGGSVKKVVRSVKKAGGKVIAACVMINRDPTLVNSKTVGAPFSSLGVFKVPSYDANECPLCKAGVPVNTALGHGKEFLAKHKKKK